MKPRHGDGALQAQFDAVHPYLHFGRELGASMESHRDAFATFRFTGLGPTSSTEHQNNLSDVLSSFKVCVCSRGLFQRESLIHTELKAAGFDQWPHDPLEGDAIPTEDQLCQSFGISCITVRRAVADPHVAQHLNVEVGAPLLCVCRLASVDVGKPVMYLNSYMTSERSRIVFNHEEQDLERMYEGKLVHNVSRKN